MKVLHVLEELRPSGAEVMLKVAAPYWETLGIQSAILSKGRSLGAYASQLEGAGYQLHHIPLGHPLRFMVQYYRHIRQQAYDAVHIHTEHANFWLAALATLAGASRVVRTSHNVFAFKGKTRVQRRVQRYVLRCLGVTHVSIGTSVEEAERVYFNNATTLIHNWYDATRFVPADPGQRRAAREALGLDDRCFVIITVGNCSCVKNHGALLEALARVKDALPFVYLHAGEEKRGEGERELAEQLGIGDRVRFMGFVKDILPLLYAADAYVMPSLHEGFSISAIEAMGAGAPVVLADVPGLRDLKALSDHIIWVHPEPSSIAEGLLAMADLSVAERAVIRCSLHRDVYEALRPERAVRAYAALYGKALPPLSVSVSSLA